MAIVLKKNITNTFEYEAAGEQVPEAIQQNNVLFKNASDRLFELSDEVTNYFDGMKVDPAGVPHIIEIAREALRLWEETIR